VKAEQEELARQRAAFDAERDQLADVRKLVSETIGIELKTALQFIEEYQRYLRDKEDRDFDSLNPEDVAEARRIAALTGESERAIFRAMYGYVDELGAIAA
jgi:hypothetical protein